MPERPLGVRPQEVNWCQRLPLLARLGGPHFHAADHGARRHPKHQGYHLRHVLRRDHPTGVARAFARLCAEFRVHAPRHNRADTYMVIAMVQHHRFAETVEPKLRGVITRAAAEGVLPGQAGDVDDEPAAAPRKLRQRFPRAVECAVQVEVDVAAPLLRRHLAHLAEHPFAGIVYQDVQATEFAFHRLEEPAHLIYLSDVRGLPEDSPQRLHAGDGRIHRVLAAPAEGHRRAFAEQPFGDGTPDAACTARHNCDLTRYRFHHLLSVAELFSRNDHGFARQLQLSPYQAG